MPSLNKQTETAKRCQEWRDAIAEWKQKLTVKSKFKELLPISGWRVLVAYADEMTTPQIAEVMLGVTDMVETTLRHPEESYAMDSVLTEIIWHCRRTGWWTYLDTPEYRHHLAALLICGATHCEDLFDKTPKPSAQATALAQQWQQRAQPGIPHIAQSQRPWQRISAFAKRIRGASSQEPAQTLPELTGTLFGPVWYDVAQDAVASAPETSLLPNSQVAALVLQVKPPFTWDDPALQTTTTVAPLPDTLSL